MKLIRTIRIIAVFAVMLIWRSETMAQNMVVDYLFNRSSEPFIPLENDTTLGSGFQDDILYMGQNLNSGPSLCTSCSLTGPGLPIGFTFTFDGSDFTRWGFSSNGFIKLGNGTFTIRNSLASAFSSIGDSSEQVNLIAALHGDIMMTGIQGSFRYKTIGNPGSRILVVEYRANKHYTPNVTSEEIYNFQIRLHEGSNKVSFIYGPFLKDAISRTYTVGLRGRFFNDIHLRSLPGSGSSWLQSSRGTSPSSTMATNTELTPVDGLVFNFIPRQYDNDLTLEEIITPLRGIYSCPLSTSEPVKVKVKNTGLLSQASAQVGYRVGSGTPVVQQVAFSPALAAQASQEVTLNVPANLSGSFPKDLTAFVFIPNEEEGSRNNDSLTVGFTIGRPFETTTISSFDTLVDRGWALGRGATSPAGTYSLWKPSTSFTVNTSALEMQVDTPLVKNEWFFSPGYRVDTSYNYGINFSAAITSGLTGTGAIADIGDDTIKFMYSTDCKQTWKLLKKFSSAEMATTEINNTLKPFEVFLPPAVNDLVTFGFFGKNNGNTAPNPYRFHFRNFFLRRVARFDMTADTVRVPSVVSLSCKYSAQELLTLRITNRGFDPIDSTEAGFFINNGQVIKKKFAFNPLLQPGASATLVFEGSSGADLSVQEGTVVTGFVALRKENISQKSNDTIRRTYALIAGLGIPTPVYNTYASALTARWQRGRGQSVPAGNFSFWGNKETLPGQVTTGVDMQATPGLVNDWFYSASYTGPSVVKFVFKAAAAAIGSGAAVTSLNNDSIKAMYSVDCGASWKSVKTFSSADLTAGNLTNSLKEYSFELLNSRGSILVGFAAFRAAASPVTSGYTFHVDSVSITTPSFSDFSSTAILPGINGTITCPGTSPVPVGVVVRNAGSVPITTATVGYKLNNVPTSKVVTFPGAGLAVGGLDTILFTGSEAPVYASAGSYKLKGFVVLSSELPNTAFNDSSGISTINLFSKVPVPYFQNFTSPGLLPIGWISDTASGNGFRQTTGRGPGGSQALSFRARQAFNRATLTTRNFGVITSDASHISIVYRSQEQSNAFFRLQPTDFIDILVSTNCGASYSQVGRIDSLNQQVAAGFLVRDFPIEAYAGQDLTVKIDAKLTPRSAFTSSFLDVSLFSLAGPTSNDALVVFDEALSMFPNPCTINQDLHLVGINSKVSRIVAISANGQVQTLPWTEGEAGAVTVNTRDLPRGLYILQVVSQSRIQTAKLLLQ